MVLLPWELEEDILSRLPPRSLVQFRSVCKRWNALFDVKSFNKDQFARARPQFIFITDSKIYSIEIIGLDGVDPTIKLHVLDSSGIPYREWKFAYLTITACDGRWIKWIEYENKGFNVCGVGYDNTRPEKVYKILEYLECRREESSNACYQRVAIYECASHAFKFIDTSNKVWFISDVQRYSVCLNGNLYWLSFDDFRILCFDFSREIVKPFCLLPCRKFDKCDLLALQVFKGDRLSLLNQCCKTRTIEIWVTKKKIDSSNNNGSDEVVWISLLTLPPNNLPNLFIVCYGISYFIYDKTTLIIYCEDENTSAACIYIIRGDLFKKFEIDSSAFFCYHCVYAPNFIPLPLM
ncbi:unnamed protein product [Arabidopsis thaliana]|uniref:Putative F-box/LRR-repeat protein At3g16555 n=2 Tax=Arabidopsis thaliana TaxID=3702 RepID=FBL44_ARATH|nr:F-box family protein [Arabidopsis thaliana]Q9LUS9.2 RecName: Full=Putative F-box/LRR-repeat protein At3g16555 [Arabidopsis thaliana]AEE75835.1 F-box family protein [Arabidopsis thaliana]VYS57593.1 unnamed protein product [Arabidopsis thaliana]|eukprot:NP_566553.1 F-box family protein [Arabidopsis thaliana]